MGSASYAKPHTVRADVSIVPIWHWTVTLAAIRPAPRECTFRSLCCVTVRQDITSIFSVRYIFHVEESCYTQPDIILATTKTEDRRHETDRRVTWDRRYMITKHAMLPELGTSWRNATQRMRNALVWGRSGLDLGDQKIQHQPVFLYFYSPTGKFPPPRVTTSK